MKKYQILYTRIKCLLGVHEWVFNCDGWTGDEWECCQWCLQGHKGTLQVWDGKQKIMRQANNEEIKRTKFPS